MSGGSQFARLRDAVLEAAGNDAFGQVTRTEYVRSRAGAAAAAAVEVVDARWSSMQVGASFQEGGLFREAVGMVRVRKDAFADGYIPRRGDHVRALDVRPASWWQVREVPESPLDGEWRLGLYPPES